MAARRRFLSALAIAALSLAVAATFDRVFDGNAWVAPLLGAAVLPHAIAFAVRAAGPRFARWDVGAMSVGLAAFVLWALLPSTTTFGAPTGETFNRLGDRLDQGLNVLRHAHIPVRPSPGIVLLTVVAVWVMAATADLLAFRRGATLGAIAPGLMVFIWIAALGTGKDAVLAGAGVGAAAAAFLAVQHQATLVHRRSWVGAVRTIAAPRAFGAAAALAAAALAIGAAVAPALPGSDEPLVDLGTGHTGASSYKSIPPLLDVAEKLRRTPSEELFTVRATTPDYWRTTALDQYIAASGGQWTLAAQGSNVGEGLSGAVPRGALRQEYRIEHLGERWMPAAYRAVSVSLSGTLVVLASTTLVTGRDIIANTMYRVDSVRPVASARAEATATGGPVPKRLRPFLELPADFPVEIRNQANAIVAASNAQTPFARARALRDWFRSPAFTYDTHVDFGDDGDAMLRFLQVRRGFCTQFATTYAAMARALGIPARVAVGFTPGTPDADGTYHVRTNDAHAWPEIWLAGLGWTHMFDPTPPTAAGGTGGSALPQELPIAGVGVPPVGGTATTVPSTASPTAPANGGTPAPTGGGANPTVTAPKRADRSTSHWWVAAAIAGGVVALLLLLVVEVPVARKARMRNARRRRDDAGQAIAGAWEEALDRLAERGVATPPTSTPIELAATTATRTGDRVGESLHSLATQYSAAAYGTRVFEDLDVDAAWAELMRLEHHLAEGDTTIERWRYRLASGRRAQPEPAGWSPRNRSTND